MTLDSQQQKDLLLQVIAAVPISGPYQTLKGAIAEIDKLEKAVINAKIDSIGNK